MMDYMMSRPLSISLLGAYFLPYALVAFGVIAFRLVRRRILRAELWLLLTFVAFVVLEFAQLLGEGRSFFNSDFWGLDRYFGVLAPFLWIFTARFVSSAWWHESLSFRPMARVVVVMGLAWVLLRMNVGMVWNLWTSGTAYDTEVAVEQIVPVIKADYRGRARQTVVRRSLYEYYTGKRPLVSSPYAAAGWAVRGDSCGATGVKCPYKEDYLFFPLGSRYGGITNIDVNVHTFIKSVRGGLGTQWMLFRRRTTPGMKR